MENKTWLLVYLQTEPVKSYPLTSIASISLDDKKIDLIIRTITGASKNFPLSKTKIKLATAEETMAEIQKATKELLNL